MRTTITGNRNLARTLGVHWQTVHNWRKSGILKPATLSDYGRIIIYDLDKVYECLNHKKVQPGRPATR